MKQVNAPTPINNYQPSKEPTLIPTEEPVKNQNKPIFGLGLPSPVIISQDDEEDIPNRYNMQSRAQAITNSIIEPHLMPALQLKHPISN